VAAKRWLQGWAATLLLFVRGHFPFSFSPFYLFFIFRAAKYRDVSLRLAANLLIPTYFTPVNPKICCLPAQLVCISLI